MKNKYKFAQALSIVISLSGIVVMAGWFFNIQALKSILPVWVTMKFSTALCFFCAGILLYYTAEFQKGRRELALVIIPISNMIILFLMGSVLASIFIGINIGIEEAFVREANGAIMTTIPGRPSAATMTNFILMSVIGFLVCFGSKKLKGIFIVLGSLICFIGGIAIVGYILNQPLLYFAIPTKSTAMAVHTAVLFVLWGLGLLVCA